MTAAKVAALGRTILFGGLEESILQALAGRAEERRLARDELLFMAGDEARGLYVIVKGTLRAFRTNPDGREQVLQVERAGATFAEVPTFDDGPYPSNVAAEEDSIVLFISKHDVRQLCMERPQIALAALRVLAGRLRRCAALVEGLSLHEVGQRLAHFLVSEARERGVVEESGTRIDLRLTNQQIATRVGSVREVVSRAITRLQQKGLIVVKRRRIIIPDLEALAEHAQI
jgi:CRP/FNR family transcriptional regulator